MPTIVCRRVHFYSEVDDRLFFEWLGRIRGVTEVVGVSDEIHVRVASRRIPVVSLLEFVALFRRYRIERIEQLAIFLNDRNRRWLADRGAGWVMERLGEGKPRRRASARSGRRTAGGGGGERL